MTDRKLQHPAMIPGSPRGLLSLVLFGLLILWAPLPFGSVTPLGEALVRLVSFSILALKLGAVSKLTQHKRIFLPAILLAGVGLLGLFQTLPLPWVAHPLASSLLEGGARGWSALSIAPFLTRSAAVGWFSAAALLTVAVVLGRHRDYRRWIGLAVLAAALLQVAYGLRALSAGEPMIWGHAISGPADRLRGTFVNPNHMALLLEIALAVALAWAWWAVSRGRGRRALDSRLSGVVFPVVIWAALLGALVLTGSRAGLLAAVLGALVQGVLLSLSQGKKRHALIVLGLAAAGLALAAGLGLNEGFRRALTTNLFEDNVRSRLQVSALSLGLWAQTPVLGTGLGTFRDAFTSVETMNLTRTTWDRAHNDYLELLVTGGAVALTLVLVALVVVVRRLWRIMAADRRTETRAAALAALGALSAVAFHELFDYGLVLPANQVVLAAIVGAALGAGFRRTRRRA